MATQWRGHGRPREAPAVASLALNWAVENRPSQSLAVLTTGLNLIYLGILLALAIAQVFRDGPVTAHRIRGAIVISPAIVLAWLVSLAIMHQKEKP